MSDEEQNKNGEDLLQAEQLPLPLEVFTPKETIRPEYNIGKFAGIIFASPYSKNIRERYTHEWDIKVGEDEARASLSIVPSLGEKRPTTTTLRVFLALLQVWESLGQPADGKVTFSARQLVEVIGWRWSGSETANRIAEHIKILQGTTMTWLFSFRDAKKNLTEKQEGMVILQSSGYMKREEMLKSRRFSVVQTVRFNSELVENMLLGHVRPFNYKQLQRISNDTTVNLYARLDLYLHDKPKWERRSLDLFREELGLVGKRYNSRRTRHQKLKELVKELDGVELYHGKVQLSIEETVDGTDWKLVARKKRRIESPKRKLHPLHNKEEAEILSEELIEEIKRQPNSGIPKEGYIVFLCQMYPHSLIRRALATAKADYRGNVKKSLTHVFVYEVKRLVKEDTNLSWHERRKK